MCDHLGSVSSRDFLSIHTVYQDASGINCYMFLLSPGESHWQSCCKGDGMENDLEVLFYQSNALHGWTHSLEVLARGGCVHKRASQRPTEIEGDCFIFCTE